MRDVTNPARHTELEKRKTELEGELRSQFSGWDRAAMSDRIHFQQRKVTGHIPCKTANPSQVIYNNVMNHKLLHLPEKWHQIIVLIIIVLAVSIRIKAQGDPRLSIANNDTASYVSSSEVSLFSWDAFSGRRLFTTNAVYQLLKPDDDYKIFVNGSVNTTKRRLQPSFVNIVLLQFTVSIISWGLLTLSITRHLKNIFPKILAAVLIVSFAFVPQIADWDSVLSSESLSFSLFALQSGLLIDLAFRFTKDPRPTFQTYILTAIWLIVIFFWAFLKDAHLYGIVVLALMIAGTLISTRFKKQKLIHLILLVLSGFILLGWISSGKSERSQIQMVNVYKSDILSDPAHIEFMRAHGMPDPGSPEYGNWFATSSKNSYLRFLLFNPGYVAINYFEDVPYAFSENAQTYFNTQPQFLLRKALIPAGNILHPENSAPMFVDILLLLGIFAVLLKNNTPENRVWGWMAVWIFLFAGTNMFVNIFGDVFALPRHALLATTAFRLFMWVFIFVFIDLVIFSREKDTSKIGNSTSR